MDKTKSQLIKITDLTTQLGLSSRSLRYYEQVGLIQSVRPEFEKYRFYDADTMERLKQIIVLRKMQIPVKDILRIYESESMSVVVDTFVRRIHEINDEIGALNALKCIVGEFLQTMLDHGITKISAIPLLYEEMDKQLELMEEQKPVAYEGVSSLSERFHSLIKSFDDNKFYEIDYTHGGEMRHPAMLENLISPDGKREMVSLLVPVRKRIHSNKLGKNQMFLKPHYL